MTPDEFLVGESCFSIETHKNSASPAGRNVCLAAVRGAGRMKYLGVGFGGALGSIARYVLSLLIYERAGGQFPYGTFVVNISGCFVIGLLLTFLDGRLELSP